MAATRRPNPKPIFQATDRLRSEDIVNPGIPILVVREATDKK